MQACILNKNKKDISPFTQSLYQLFRTKGDTLILSYPYMRKTIFDKCYKRESDEESREDVYIRKSKIYTRERFKNCIIEGFSECENPTIKLIGSMQEIKYKKDMISFAFELEKILARDDINIELYITKEKNYYNKLAIKLDDNNIKMMISGSSNFCTLSLWESNYNSYNEDLDILFYDKYRLEKNTLNILKKINESMALEKSDLVDKMKMYKLISCESLKIINNNNYIISPLEPYRMKEKILEEVNSDDFTKICVKHYKLDLLKGVFYYLIGFYKERKDNNIEEKEKYESLRSNLREYMTSLNKKDIYQALKIVQENNTIKKLLFETTKGNITLYQLVLNILNYNDKEIKNMFKRFDNQGFINYYNGIYDYKL